MHSKIWVFVAALILCLMITFTAAIEKSKMTKEKCNEDCALSYDPICVGIKDSPTEKPKSFGSECVLRNYNCQNNANLQTLYAGECKGGGGIRLS